MSGQPAYIPIFGNDYLGDTMHLTTEEHGAYFLLMLAAWRQDDCSLPFDDKKLSKIVRLPARRWDAIKETILEFWTVEAGRIYQPRLRKEWNYARKKSEANRKSASARWDKQVTENIEGASCERTTERNAPQPKPQPKEEEPNGSPSFSAGESGDGLFTQDALPVAPKRGAKAKRSVGIDTPLSDDWEPTLTPAAQAMVDGWPPGALDREEFQFRNHAIANGRKAKDWDAAFRMWIGKADERHGNGNRNSNWGAPAGHRQPRTRTDGFTDAINDALARTGSGPATGPSGQAFDDYGSGDTGLRPARARVIR